MIEEKIYTVEEIPSGPLPGSYAWYTMSIGILAYDLYAMKYKKAETMSSAIWRSLSDAKKASALVAGWMVLTHHLFANKRARNHYQVHLTKTIKRGAKA